MPSATFTIQTDADDGWTSFGTWLPSDGIVFQGAYFGSGRSSGLRFTGVTIPAGKTIIVATLSLNVTYVSGTAPFGVLHGVASDNAPAWVDGGHTPDTASLTTANIPVTTASPGGVQTLDVKTVVQEIVSRPGWSSGNALALAGAPTGAVGFNTYIGWADYSDNPSAVASLYIEWGDAPPLTTANASGAVGALTLSASGKVALKGTAARTLAITSSAAGKVAVAGQAVKSVGTITVSSTAVVRLAAAASAQVGTVVASASGAVVSPLITAVAAGTVGALVSSATAKLPLVGVGNSALSVAASAGAKLALKADAASGIGAIACAAVGRLPIASQSAVSIGAISALGTGKVPLVASASGAIEPIVPTSTVRLPIMSVSSAVMGAIQSIAVGSLPIRSMVAGVVAEVQAIATGSLPLRAAAAVAMQPIEAAGAAALHLRAVSASTLSAIVALAQIKRLPRGLDFIMTGRAACLELTGAGWSMELSGRASAPKRIS